MKRMALLLAVFICTQLSAQAMNIDSLIKKGAKAFMKEAITEGLEHFKYNPTDAAAIANRNELFIGKCNICGGSQAGFKAYAERPRIMMVQEFYSDTTILSKDKQKALKALEKLVSECTNYYYEKYQFSTAQKAKMQQLLTDEKKRSSMMTNGRFCASCEGSCKLPETD
jgi:hypothetical protein